MKKLDWYILKKFLGTFVFIMALLLGITVVIDLSEKIDNLIENHAPAREVIFGYYTYFIPYIVSLIGPFFILVSVIFFTSQLASRSEIVAILNSGTSFYRMLWPYFVGATILFLTFYCGNHYIIPFANHRRIAFENKYVSKPYMGASFNFHRSTGPGTIIYLENYKPADSSGYRFTIDKFDSGRLVYKLRADRIDWNKKDKKWRVTNYYERWLGNMNDRLATHTFLDTAYSFKPSDFTFAEHLKEEMTTPELKKYIAYMYKAGQPDIEFFEVERYRRTASAFSIYILTLIGVSVASRKVRGGLGWHLVLGIGLSAVYELTMKFSITFATNASLPPLLAVWIPNLLFAGMAFYLLKKAPK